MKFVFRIIAIATAVSCFAQAQYTHAATEPVVVGAVAHRTQGAAGSFDLSLSGDRTKPTVEARQGTSHAVVFTFDKAVNSGSAVITVGSASVGAPTFSGTKMTVPLTSVKDAQYVRIAVKNVVAADGGTGGRGAVSVGFLQGDVDQTRAVTDADVSLVNAGSGKPVTAANFQLDIDANGTINNSDKKLVNTGATHVLPAAPANRPPVANAGPAQSVPAGTTVSLDGNASSDPDGDALGFAWILTLKPNGSAAALVAATSSKPSLTTDLPGAYVIAMIVHDGLLQSTTPASVTITATAANRAPVASAGSAQSVTAGTTVSLNGSASSDPDGDALSFAWTLTSKPSGSTAALVAPTNAKPSFTADLAGAYVATLVVNDGRQNSTPATVTITAAAANRAPVANAGSAQSVTAGTTASLNGSASSDPDGDALSFAWTLTSKPSGSAAAVVGPTSANPSLTTDVAGAYVATLVVNDGRQSSTPATVTITAAAANRAPVASAGSAQSVTPGTTVSLNGSASSDPDGDALTFAWTLTSKPSGSTAALVAPTSANPSLTTDVAGAYVATLVVNDGRQSSTPASVTITAAGATDQRRDAARFMRQATFGATRTAIDAVVTQGYSAWLDEQFAKPATSHLATVKADPALLATPWSVTMPSVWKQFFEGEDQLRQRVAFALSQIYVVSLNHNTVLDAPCGAAGYLDILNRGAFGNVRDLLKDITLNPVMGEYLSLKETAKADPVLQTQPDENYAREIMQLFSIGTVMLNLDGTVKLDGLGKPIPTYTEETVKQFAKALSGWSYAGQDQSNPWRWLFPDLWDLDNNIHTQKGCPAWSNPMQAWTRDYISVDASRLITGPAHDTTSKQLLVYAGAPYSTLPANQSPQVDLENAIDNVFNHPNVGPFLAKQLIARLVTSNPSPQYVARVAAKFNDNGSGVRGDMKAVVRAILLDNDARSLAVAGTASFGKLTEPVVRFVQLHRAFNAKRANGYYDIIDLGAPSLLNQSPVHAPSVFNFYRPDYAPAGPVSQSNLVAPEFEITNATSVAGFADLSKWGIINGWDYYSGDPGRQIRPDYSYYLALTTTPAQLVDELDIVLCGGGMNASYKAQIAQAVGKVSWYNNPSGEALERLNMALWLIINSPDYSVQK